MGSPAPESELGPNALLYDPPPWHKLELVRPPSTSAEPPPGFSAESPGELLRSTVPYLLPSPAAYSPAPSPSSSPRFERMPVTTNRIGAVGLIVVGAIGSVLLIMALLWICSYINKNLSRRNDLSPGPPAGGQQHVPPQTANNRPVPTNAEANSSVPPLSRHNTIGNSTIIFTYEELKMATNNFSESNFLGEGGFSKVYKGRLPDGRVVAIKQLKPGRKEWEREFKAEVGTISRVHHRHLVSLVGYCMSEEHRLLVYEFVANKTLQFHLHEPGGPVLSWQNRMKIARGSARGLAYLHQDCQPKIIHRDIKSANILIDENFEAKVADFGLAKSIPDSRTHVFTRAAGTVGCVDPEYALSGKLNESSDTYSFGVLLLELITGRPPVHENINLVNWARPLLTPALENGNFNDLVDKNLKDQYDPEQMKRMVACARTCVLRNKRPKMIQIARALEGIIPLEDLNEGIEPGQSSSVFMTAGDQNPSGPSAEVVESRKHGSGAFIAGGDQTLSA